MPSKKAPTFCESCFVLYVSAKGDGGEMCPNQTCPKWLKYFLCSGVICALSLKNAGLVLLFFHRPVTGTAQRKLKLCLLTARCVPTKVFIFITNDLRLFFHFSRCDSCGAETEIIYCDKAEYKFLGIKAALPYFSADSASRSICSASARVARKKARGKTRGCGISGKASEICKSQ